MKKIIIVCMCTAIVLAFFKEVSVKAAYNNRDRIMFDRIVAGTNDETNSILLDENNRILYERHVDGETLTYSYKTDKLSMIENSNGATESFNYKSDGAAVITRYRKGPFMAKEEVIVSNEPCELDNKIGVNATVPETMIGNVNLSIMCPSSWHVDTSKDKFKGTNFTMGSYQIQKFLTEKNSPLRSDIVVYKLDGAGNVYNTGKRIKPSAVIHKACEKYGINPKIILGSLQREQSLITKGAAFNSRSMYYCMGYGATDSGDYNNCAGFDVQIDGGTKLYSDFWMEAYNMGRTKFPYSFSAKDGQIYLENCGAYALYTYTPWKKSNKLFIDVMRSFWPGNGVNGINWD
ncbi:MAG: hypothetical protein K5858_01165 [Lachnospiraceae bacterium]|nr:hypothetical protein [Lachnospiraceae bacterium]